ncbi:hypothetical protein KEJ27_08455 [Candidatus Bathyarchaeota archaeon]|nr:hypothetical protein [Candidatus Bathyarchaeota archaeon]MBS7618580.1 hypothetical protein [Candidatus Bathyarchaeota archaeon]
MSLQGESIREENFNVVLAELLTERGLKALGKVVLRRRGGRLEPDVLIELNGVRIVIEGKSLVCGTFWLSSVKTDWIITFVTYVSWWSMPISN